MLRVLIFILLGLVVGVWGGFARCSHQGRLHEDGLFSPGDVLENVEHLVALGVDCFDLDVRGRGLDLRVGHTSEEFDALPSLGSFLDAVCGLGLRSPVVLTLEPKSLSLGSHLHLVLSLQERRESVECGGVVGHGKGWISEQLWVGLLESRPSEAHVLSYTWPTLGLALPLRDQSLDGEAEACFVAGDKCDFSSILAPYSIVMPSDLFLRHYANAISLALTASPLPHRIPLLQSSQTRSRESNDQSSETKAAVTPRLLLPWTIATPAAAWELEQFTHIDAVITNDPANPAWTD